MFDPNLKDAPAEETAPETAAAPTEDTATAPTGEGSGALVD